MDPYVTVGAYNSIVAGNDMVLAYKNGTGLVICPNTVAGQGNGIRLDTVGNTTVY